MIRFEDSYLLYFSRDDWFAAVRNGKCSHIKVTFETNDNAIDEFDYGVNLLYEQDVEEFNQTNAQCLIECFGEEVPIYKLTSNDHLTHPSH